MNAREKVAVNRAMNDPDLYVVQVNYIDKEGKITQRIVSPIRWISATSMLALCLCREMPRRFELERCTNVQLVRASDVLMPVEIKVLEAEPIGAIAS